MCGDPNCPLRLTRRKREVFVEPLPAPLEPFRSGYISEGQLKSAVAAQLAERTKMAPKRLVRTIAIASVVGVVMLATLSLLWLG